MIDLIEHSIPIFYVFSVVVILDCCSVLLRSVSFPKEEMKHKIQVLKAQMSNMQESQLKIIELLNNPAMVQHIRANPSHDLGAADAAEKDIADFIKQQRERKS